MDKLKFNKNETISIGKLSYISNDIYKLEVENITEDIALSGFYLLNENNDEIMETIQNLQQNISLPMKVTHIIYQQVLSILNQKKKNQKKNQKRY